MRTTIIALAAMLSCSSIIASAANQAPAGFGNFQPMDASQRVEQLAKSITDMTDAQKTQLTDLLKKQDEARQARMQEMMQNGGGFNGDFESIMAKIKEEREAENAEVKKILNDDQFKKYEDWQKAQMPNFGGQF